MLNLTKKINIPASKSISNRLLVLQYLYPQIQIENLSTAQDTVHLKNALESLAFPQSSPTEINIGHAGTAMRFLTALLSREKAKSFVLDGSERMRQRPIGILVKALQELGADISYQKKHGYPPLLINGKKLTKNKIQIPAHISSQYITALMLIAPRLPHGLQIVLSGKQVSTPYVSMTARLMRQAGIPVNFKGNIIDIAPVKNLPAQQFHVEGDWSSASYFYGRMLATDEKELILSPFLRNSLQGDAQIAEYFSKLGIETIFIPEKQQIILRKIPGFQLPATIAFDLLHTPDLAQTLAVTCLVLGIRCQLTGLETLKIKETDRLQALQTEMQKLGAGVHITNHSLEIFKPEIHINNPVEIATYNDHRMAMSFAILQKKFPMISIADKNVVIKSFPDFWNFF